MLKQHTPSLRTIDSLGALRAEHHPSVPNQIAGGIIAILAVIGACLVWRSQIREVLNAQEPIPIFATSGMSWAAAGLFCLLGVGFLSIAAALAHYVYTTWKLRLLIYSQGFVIVRRAKTLVFAWDEIVRVEECVVHTRFPIPVRHLSHLLPRSTERTYSIHRCDGEEFRLNSLSIPHPDVLTLPLFKTMKNRREIVVTTTEATL